MLEDVAGFILNVVEWVPIVGDSRVEVGETRTLDGPKCGLG